MTEILKVKAYSEPEFDRKEILRYVGGGETSSEICNLIEDCILELKGKLSYRVCYRVFDISVEENSIDLGFVRVNSKALGKNLDGCDKIVLFAATVGIEIDRLITRYGRVSPSRALMFQAIGAERIEKLCDIFNTEIDEISKDNGYSTRPRFSPGYGDFPLEIQKDIFNVLDCSRKIGLSLNKSFLMSPSKSVTAVIGLGKCRNSEK